MDSFYGGQPGATPVFRDKFGSINEMLAAFQDSNYTQCYYGEYCLIDCSLSNNTSNAEDSVSWRNKPEHGNVYKRTYSGAEYMGNIAGPAGALGNITVSSIEDVLEYLHDNADEQSSVRDKNIIFPLKDGNTNWDSKESTDGPVVADIDIDEQNNIVNNNVKVGYFPLSQNPRSGFDAKGISYSWYKSENDKLGSMVNIGLDIPAPAIEFFPSNKQYSAPYVSGEKEEENGKRATTSASIKTKFSKEPFYGSADSETIKEKPFYFPVELEIYQPPKGIEISKIHHAPVFKEILTESDTSDGTGQASRVFYKIKIDTADTTAIVKQLKDGVKSPYNTDGSINEDMLEPFLLNTELYKEDAEIWYIVVSDYSSNILKPEKHYIFAGYYDVLIDMNRGDENSNGDYGAVTKKYSASRDEIMNLNTSAFISKIQEGAPTQSANSEDRNGLVFDETAKVFYAYDWDNSQWKEIGGFSSTQLSAYPKYSHTLTNKFTRWDSLNNIRPTSDIILKDASEMGDLTEGTITSPPSNSGSTGDIDEDLTAGTITNPSYGSGNISGGDL